MNTLPLYIGGRFENGADPSQEIVNPASGAPLGRAARASRAETEAAIGAARAIVAPVAGLTIVCVGSAPFTNRPPM